MNVRNRYIDLLLHVVLHIQEGEALSINTDLTHLEFAKDLAQEASEITLQEVHIVTITDGKPEDVLSITPVMNEQSVVPPARALLLRIDDTETRQWHIDEQPETILKNMALLQRCGNLGPPQLNRPVAPWSVIAVPGPSWAENMFGSRKDEQQLWNIFSKVLRLDRDDYLVAWEQAFSLMKNRLSELNRLDCTGLRITGTGTDLMLTPLDESRWRGGLHTLSNGRTFVPYLPGERISMLANRFLTKGTVTASRPFPLLGKLVEKATLTFFEGKVVDFDATKGKDQLAIALGADDGSSRLAELSLVDILAPLAELERPSGYYGFDENQVSSIILGMGDASHLEALGTYESEEELQQETGCNISLIRFRVPIGDSSLCVKAVLSDGSELDIMRNGTFLSWIPTFRQGD